jgi:hypothetical protein
MADKKLNYFQAGIVAKRQGRSITDHEYSPGSHPAREWEQGWKAEKEMILEQHYPHDYIYLAGYGYVPVRPVAE